MKTESSGLKPWLIVLVALIDDIAALALVFVILWAFHVDIPVYLLVIIGILAGIVIFIIHRAIIPSLRRRKVIGKEGMLGEVGEVTKTLTPQGVVKVKDEYWQAESENGDISRGEEVEIIGINGLTLKVKHKE
jgi:membrane-bound ClpP family serine protease